MLCFPYGLFLMWRRDCRWHMALKCVVTAAFALAVCAIVFAPTPVKQQDTTITLTGSAPEIEVFGPQVPEGYDVTAYITGEEDPDLFAEVEQDDTVYVYASANEGSTYYHTSICKFAYASSRRMTLYEAYMLGYTTPCQNCNPPIYDPAADAPAQTSSPQDDLTQTEAAGNDQTPEAN